MVSAMTTVSNWFILKRGRALAITTMGAAISALVVIPFTQFFVINISWQAAWVMLGLMTWILLALPSAIFIRRRPEDMGLLPDGGLIEEFSQKKKKKTDVGKTVELSGIEVNWTTKEAMQTRAFWFVLVSQILTTFGVMGVWLHMIASFTDQGISPGQAALAMGSISITSIPSRVAWGLIAEKYDLRLCTIVSYIGLATSFIIIMIADTFLIAISGILLNGLFFGGVIVLHTMVWPEYYGRLSLGSIQGYAELFRVIGFAGGPLLAGIIYDLTGSYYTVFTSFTLGCLIATMFMYFAKPPIGKIRSNCNLS
jgi:MFS family permease